MIFGSFFTRLISFFFTRTLQKTPQQLFSHRLYHMTLHSFPPLTNIFYSLYSPNFYPLYKNSPLPPHTRYIPFQSLFHLLTISSYAPSFLILKSPLFSPSISPTPVNFSPRSQLSLSTQKNAQVLQPLSIQLPLTDPHFPKRPSNTVSYPLAHTTPLLSPSLSTYPLPPQTNAPHKTTSHHPTPFPHKYSSTIPLFPLSTFPLRPHKRNFPSPHYLKKPPVSAIPPRPPHRSSTSPRFPNSLFPLNKKFAKKTPEERHKRPSSGI